LKSNSVYYKEDFNNRFYLPNEYLVIDEGMIPFNGDISWKVFNPDKPTKWGLKEYLLCDGHTSYTLKIILYYGMQMWELEFPSDVNNST